MSPRERREAWEAVLFLSPWIIGFLVFTVISMTWSLVLSFQNFDLATNIGTPAGFGNYQLLLDDPKASALRLSTSALALVGEPVVFGMHPEDAPDFLARQGWTAVDVADAAELERRYVTDGRTVYPANHVVVARRA